MKRSTTYCETSTSICTPELLSGMLLEVFPCAVVISFMDHLALARQVFRLHWLAFSVSISMSSVFKILPSAKRIWLFCSPDFLADVLSFWKTSTLLVFVVPTMKKTKRRMKTVPEKRPARTKAKRLKKRRRKKRRNPKRPKTLPIAIPTALKRTERDAESEDETEETERIPATGVLITS